jgi:hypothetical protein
MKRAVLLAAAIPWIGCGPEIGNGTYFCGPERYCPPAQECDDNKYTCDSPSRATRFACPVASQASEPDDTDDQAENVGRLQCGMSLVAGRQGCVSDAGDVDQIAFELAGTCLGDNPHLSISLRFPVALVPLHMELLDGAGAVVAEAELCTASGDVTGTDLLCIRHSIPEGRYRLRIRSVSGAPDCGGDCHHNQYTLDVAYPLA